MSTPFRAIDPLIMFWRNCSLNKAQLQLSASSNLLNNVRVDLLLDGSLFTNAQSK